MEERTIQLLEDIKRLLTPMSVAAEPQYQAIMKQRNEAVIKAILDIVGRSAIQLSAAKLMDGSRNASEIRAATGFDGSNFSKFCKKLRDVEALTDTDGKLRLTVDPTAIQWPEATKGK